MIIPGIVLVLILLFVFRKVLRVFLSPVATYNDLVTLRNTVQNAWAQIDVQLKRRHDLISNYVEIVKGYAKHERGTLEEVAKARSRAAGATTMAERSDAENALASTMKSLYAVVESYPELKANQNFIALQHNLTETENILAGKREAYNNTVLTYNNRVQRFPTNLFAKVFRFKVRDFFELKSETEREAPKASI
ncbi:MAG: LemA family protein [Verrucomicrobiae bacterium]|nr:LemA family protein [Verrucomicrobiae bacterium]